ncbi:MAG: Site-specific recombinase [uncultured Sulfurovum sp.]|uniref:Site-specific recombinase n=1 Tax=uncultured Sulfurovum sp. TaxID=269237 RepID=A0A6S6U7D5_9BACT|nr:MAG: Site-specific recombinase [uncultured Sulfurovum sp.]
MREEIKRLHETLDNDEIDIIDKLADIIAFIRPTYVSEIEKTLAKMQQIIKLFENKESVTQKVSDDINILLIHSKISNNITNLGILSHNGFRHELSKRFYNKFLPKPPKKGDFEYILALLFPKKDDHIWVNAIDDEMWISFYASILLSDTYEKEMKDHLFSEILYAAEIIAIKIASEEFDDNFIRLDKSLLNRDSAFIALHRDMNDFVHKIQEDHIELNSTDLDMRHIQVLLEQCKSQVNHLKKRSLNRGISVSLTYELERIGQMVKRVEELMLLIKKFDTPQSYIVFMKLFKESVIKNSSKNSIYAIYQQGIRVLAKSVTNNTSEHGEHYITNTTQKYIKMFFSASGAGILIAMMALIKINIVQAGFSEAVVTILSSLNYGLGFVLIHLLGFTVATKQPAMTASTFAKAVEKGDNRRADQKKLVALFFQVSRSQFAAVLGNVTLALLVAWGIAYLAIKGDNTLLTATESEYYLMSIQPYPALIYAAIAGIWLFCAGLIAGYFDNRANLLELRERYFYHPFLKKVMKDKNREKFANYLHDHHGAIVGNFFFGVLLGITPYIGYLIELPLDISHVAFSTAYLGYSTMHLDVSTAEFFLLLLFVLLIGLVNLSVSFVLALKVSLLSRDSYFGNLFSFVKLFAKEVLRRPQALFFPPLKEKRAEQENRTKKKIKK